MAMAAQGALRRSFQDPKASVVPVEDGIDMLISLRYVKCRPASNAGQSSNGVRERADIPANDASCASSSPSRPVRYHILMPIELQLQARLCLLQGSPASQGATPPAKEDDHEAGLYRSRDWGCCASQVRMRPNLSQRNRLLTPSPPLYKQPESHH
jgi:hypothetical protein